MLIQPSMRHFEIVRAIVDSSYEVTQFLQAADGAAEQSNSSSGSTKSFHTDPTTNERCRALFVVW